MGFVAGFEVVDGFEGEAEFVFGSAVALVEDEAVGADVESEGDVSEYVEGGRGGACFVAPDLGDVDAGSFGEGVLGEFSLFAGGGEAFGEAHGGPGGRGGWWVDHRGGPPERP